MNQQRDIWGEGIQGGRDSWWSGLKLVAGRSPESLFVARWEQMSSEGPAGHCSDLGLCETGSLLNRSDRS